MGDNQPVNITVAGGVITVDPDSVGVSKKGNDQAVWKGNAGFDIELKKNGTPFKTDEFHSDR